MHVFAIGDIPLPGGMDKPMDVFGPHWEGHFDRMSRYWRDSIQEGDIVLIPGDISWAMQLNEAMEDILALSELPGRKVLLRGNHDYWWRSISKLRAVLPDTVHAIQNDSLEIDGLGIAGSRGWNCPGSQGFTDKDKRIYERELQRLRLSLSTLPDRKNAICMMHFPPCCDRNVKTGFTELFDEFEIEHVVYAHLHGIAHKGAFEGRLNGTTYTLCSSDHLNFRPKMIL